MSDLLTAEQVAAQLNLKPTTVRTGGALTWQIPRVRLGRLIRYRQEDVDRWLAKQVRGPFQVSKVRNSG